MKRKTDFVTNSSSTSFVVWGATIDLHNIPEEMEKRFRKEACLICSSRNNCGPYDSNSCLSEFISSKHFECARMPDSDELMFGRSPFEMKDDETLKEFKIRLTKDLLQCGIFIDPDKLVKIEESWQDG